MSAYLTSIQMRFCSMLLVSSAFAMCVFSSGCSTIGDDLDALTSDLVAKTPFEAAEMMIDPHDPDRRRRGTVLISNAPFGGGDKYLSIYRDKVRNERNPLALAAALTALGRHGQTDDAILIAILLEHENIQVRWEAAKALQRIHNPIAVPPLLKTLAKDDEHSDVRVAAAIALGQYPEDRVFHGLISALDFRELEINIAARRSLKILTSQSFGLIVSDWYQWYESAQDPFADRKEYLYPTYQRDETWIERLTFWSTPSFEKPAPPVGSLSESKRKTYQDDDEPSADETDG
ncbi:MAG: HEAT repeat domain-containing protein [Planctomycetes bacterium]|nr:HEAT repeat domain-containing protein [Planctomycetota bacterium]